VLISFKSAFAGTREGSRGGRLLRPHDTLAVKVDAHHASGLNSTRRSTEAQDG
jgi:hypothetical protein